MLADLKNLRAFFSIGVVRGSLAWEPSLILDQVEAETELEFRFDLEAYSQQPPHPLTFPRPDDSRRSAHEDSSDWDSDASGSGSGSES